MKRPHLKAHSLLFGLGIATLLLGAATFAFFPLLSPERSQRLYESAQQKCGDQFWIVIEDIGAIVGKEQAPFQEKYSGDDIIDYACTEQGAVKIADRANSQSTFGFVLMILALPVLGILSLGLLIASLIVFLISRHKKSSNHI